MAAAWAGGTGDSATIGAGGGGASVSDGAGANPAGGAATVGMGAAAADAGIGPAAVLGAGGCAGCSGGIRAGLADAMLTAEAFGVDGGEGVVDTDAVSPAGAPPFGGTDGAVSADGWLVTNRESSRLATTSRPSDITTTDRATQLASILTA